MPSVFNVAHNLLVGLGKKDTDSIIATPNGGRACNVCGTRLTPGNEPHFEDDRVLFLDGCGYWNRRCTVADVWIWSYLDEGDNPHGHELPARWPRRLLTTGGGFDG